MMKLKSILALTHRKLMTGMLNQCHVPGSVLWVKSYDTRSSKAESRTVPLTPSSSVKIDRFSSSIRASSLPFSVFRSGLELTGYRNAAFHGSAFLST